MGIGCEKGFSHQRPMVIRCEKGFSHQKRARRWEFATWDTNPMD